MSVHWTVKTGVIPGVQQVTGACEIVIGIIGTITFLAKSAFHKLQLEYQKIFTPQDPNRIKELKDNVEDDLIYLQLFAETLGYGLLTVIPVVGTITNAIMWYKKTHWNVEESW